MRTTIFQARGMHSVEQSVQFAGPKIYCTNTAMHYFTCIALNSFQLKQTIKPNRIQRDED